MANPMETLQGAISEIEKLSKFLNKSKTPQVRSVEEKKIVMATAYTWTKKHRPILSGADNLTALSSLDKKYSTLLEYSAKDTSRSKYKTLLKELKGELVSFRTETFTNQTVGNNSNDTQTPDFSPLVSDERMRAILERRWKEIMNCLNNDSAPLSAVIMMGGVLEALLIARINRLTDKSPIFKLKTVPTNKKTGKPAPFSEWTLNDYVEVACEMTWIRKPARDVGKVMRDYRNLIHPERELSSGIIIEAQDAQMFLPIFVQLSNQIIEDAKLLRE